MHCWLLRGVSLLAWLAPPVATLCAADEPARVVVEGLKRPESAATAFGGRTFVSVIGEFNQDGDGAVMEVREGKATAFVKNLNDPKGLAAHGDSLYVADKTEIWQIAADGQMRLLAPASAFPQKPRFLNDLAIDPESGTLYASDSGNLQGQHGAVYRVTPQGRVEVVLDQQAFPALHTPNGLALDGASHLLVLDFGTGVLVRVKLSTRAVEKVADGFGGGDGLAWDKFGRLFITDHPGGKLWCIPRPGLAPVLVKKGLNSPADLTLDASGEFVLIPGMQAGTLTAVAVDRVPGHEVDTRPLALQTAVAFPKLKWTGFPAEDTGVVVKLRPIVLCGAGDGSGRVFVATQRGVIHSFPNDDGAEQTTIFLDLQDRVTYDDRTNEEGFLGLAFHPRFKDNGELYVFYTLRGAKLTNVLSRFRLRRDDPTRADPDSEEVLLRVERPFWNHDGGTLCFGPDGYLYLALGDGGAANDPYDNGQNLATLLGSVLRIDVDRKGPDKPYAIPKDNPFVSRPGVAAEIFAYGLRNPWRIAFDRQTGQLWAADVGQNLYEEINLLQPGGNYGWNRREGFHPFGAKGRGVDDDYREPIWEYHHDIGNSITGGSVYRGKALPELQGAYLYGDYVSAKIWALWYDHRAGRVTANRPIRDRGAPILSFGEDDQGEIYLLTTTPTGQGIYRFVRSQP